MSFTWYVALQREDVRAFLPVHVSRETKFRHDLKSPLAQSDAVLRPETHVSPVKPLHAGGARRTAVHLDACGVFSRAAECSRRAADSGEARCVLIHIQCATRSDWHGARSLRCNNEAARCSERWGWGWGGGVQPFATSNSRARRLASEPCRVRAGRRFGFPPAVKPSTGFPATPSQNAAY